MKKKISLILTIFISSLLLVIFAKSSLAAVATYNVNINGSSTATKGSTLTLTFEATNLSEMPDKYDGIEGLLVYDENDLEFQSANNLVTNWVLYSAKHSNGVKILGYDDYPPANAKNTNTNIFSATFKVLDNASSSTTVSFTNIKGSTGFGENVVANDVSKTITINDNIKLSANNYLKNINITSNNKNIALNPTFNKTITSYNLSLDSSINNINISAEPEDNKAKITQGTGNKILNSGNNLVSIIVKAENGDTRTYNININKAQVKSSDNYLKSLSVSNASIYPSFNPNTSNYSVDVDPNTISVNINAIPNNSKSKVVISGNKGLKVGKNNIIVEVYAENGNKRVYTIVVNRKAPVSPKTSNTSSSNKTNNYNNDNNDNKKSNNNYLKYVYGIDGLKFDKNKTNYDITVPFETSNIKISAKAEDNNAKLSIDNSNLSNMEVDKLYTAQIKVVAENGEMRVYTFNIKRSQYKSETLLKELKIDGEDKLNELDDDILNITTNKDTINIEALPLSSESKVTIKGSTKLKDGNNVILVEVKDKNGFVKTYTINVNKEKQNKILDFINEYYPILLFLLLLLLLLIIIIILLHRNKDNKTIIYNQYYDDNNNVHNHNIDNKDKILYDNDNKEYIPKHMDDD